MVGVVGRLRPSWRAGFAGLLLARWIHECSLGMYGDLLDKQCVRYILPSADFAKLRRSMTEVGDFDIVVSPDLRI
jgi:hypothetical protein